MPWKFTCFVFLKEEDKRRQNINISIVKYFSLNSDYAEGDYGGDSDDDDKPEEEDDPEDDEADDATEENAMEVGPGATTAANSPTPPRL